MVSFSRTLRRITAAVCVSVRKQSPTNVNVPKPVSGKNLFSPQSLVNPVAVDTEVLSTSATKPTKVKSPWFRKFRPSKRLAAKAKKLKKKLGTTLTMFRKTDSNLSPSTAPHSPIIAFPDCTTALEFFPEDPEAFSPFDYSHDVFYSMRALYDLPIEDAVSSNRHLVISLVVSNATGQTSVASVEFPKNNLQSLFSIPLITYGCTEPASEVPETYDVDRVEAAETNELYCTMNPHRFFVSYPRSDTVNVPKVGCSAADMAALSCPFQFSSLFFKRLLKLLPYLQNYHPTYSPAQVKNVCTQSCFDCIFSLQVKLSNVKGTAVEKALLANVFLVRRSQFVNSTVSQSIPHTGKYAPYVLWEIQSWDNLKFTSYFLWLEDIKEANLPRVVEVVPERGAHENDEGGEFNDATGLVDPEEDQNTEEVEEFLDFIASAIDNIPDFRMFHSTNVEYQVADVDFMGFQRDSTVTFSNFDQVAEFYSDEAPLALAVGSDSEWYQCEPLKSCLKRSKPLISEAQDDWDGASETSEDFVNFETDDSWFEELCRRFVWATKITGCPENADDRYWEEVENFIDISQLTFWKLTVGVNEVKIYGLHEYVGQCEWAVKLVSLTLYSFLGIANRYEVLLEKYRHVNDSYSLDYVRVSLIDERNNLGKVRKSLDLVSNGAKYLASELGKALDYYTAECQACIAAISTVILEFDKFFSDVLLKSYPTCSPQTLQKICGKTDFISTFGEFHKTYVRDAKLAMTCNVDDLRQGVQVLVTLDASIEKAIVELLNCVCMEMELTDM